MSRIGGKKNLTPDTTYYYNISAIDASTFSATSPKMTMCPGLHTSIVLGPPMCACEPAGFLHVPAEVQEAH
jgi:hypothetical protein